MIWARSLFIISVVKPGTGECCQIAALLLEFLAERRDGRPIAACGPLRDGGQARLDRALRAGERRQCERGRGSSEQTTPCDHWHGTFLPVSTLDALAASLYCISGGLHRRGRHAAAASQTAGGKGQRGIRIIAARRRHESERHLGEFAPAQQAGIDPVDQSLAIVVREKRRPAADDHARTRLHVQRIADRKAEPEQPAPQLLAHARRRSGLHSPNRRRAAAIPARQHQEASASAGSDV